jgi:hypothetical protein
MEYILPMLCNFPLLKPHTDKIADLLTNSGVRGVKATQSRAHSGSQSPHSDSQNTVHLVNMQALTEPAGNGAHLYSKAVLQRNQRRLSSQHRLITVLSIIVGPSGNPTLKPLLYPVGNIGCFRDFPPSHQVSSRVSIGCRPFSWSVLVWCYLGPTISII